MSSCNKDLYDYDLVKKCSKCKILSLKSNFHKNKKLSDGLYEQCKVCRKEYYMNNSIELVQKQNEKYLENRDQTKEYQLKNHGRIIAN